MPTPSFQQRQVLAFENRRAREIETLIRTYEGRPLIAPAMREVPLDAEADADALAFARAVIGRDFDAFIFLTGVGARALFQVADRAAMGSDFLDALRAMRVIVRGPKPAGVLREWDVPVWLKAPEPNTWRELIGALDDAAGEWSLAGRHVALQEYGVSNPELLEALRARGARVTAQQAYQWAMPDDLEPLRAAARAAARGEVDVLMVTSAYQVVHFWRVVQDLGLEDPVRAGLARALIASIGPSASAELRRHGFDPGFEPTHPKMGFLVREAAERAGDAATRSAG